MNSLAPIGISTYIRKEHLKKTIESLKKNKLADKSDLFIFSDAPKMGDEKKVEELRTYLDSIDGFRSVKIVKREENNIVFNNCDGMRELLDNFGKMIFLEEDNICSSVFLEFMNEGLRTFENDKRIFSIHGYNFPSKKLYKYKQDYYLSKYFNGWGYATWDDRNILQVLNNNDCYNEVMQDNNLKNKLKKIHPNLLDVLLDIQNGIIDAGDYKLAYNLIKKDLFTVKPIFSFVNNIGHDGSGEHCIKDNKFTIEKLNEKKIIFDINQKYIEKIDREYYRGVTKNKITINRIVNKINKLVCSENV